VRLEETMRSTCALETCGKPFEAKRSDARYCSASCRAKASRERQGSEGPDPGPSREVAPRADPRPLVADAPPDQDRLTRLEERVLDLEADVDASEHERDAMQRLRTRLETTVARTQAAAEQAQGSAEAATRAAVEPVQRELAAIKAASLKRGDLAELRAAVEQVERRLAAMEERVEAAPAPEERLDELEQAVIKLARRVGGLREEFDYLVQAIAS
jgi:chromosome segregation ATPase